MVIVQEKDFSEANQIFAKYGSKPVYSVLPYNGLRYVIFESGAAAALLEVDIKIGCRYEGGKIINHDQIQHKS